MRFLKDFVWKMILVQVVGVIGLLLAGFVLTLVQRDDFHHEVNFFTYRVHALDYTPAWFVFVMIQMAINGIYLFRLAVLEGSVDTPNTGPFGTWGVRVPLNYLRLFAANLVLIPVSIFAFMAIRCVGL